MCACAAEWVLGVFKIMCGYLFGAPRDLRQTFRLVSPNRRDVFFFFLKKKTGQRPLGRLWSGATEDALDFREHIQYAKLAQRHGSRSLVTKAKRNTIANTKGNERKSLSFIPEAGPGKTRLVHGGGDQRLRSVSARVMR